MRRIATVAIGLTVVAGNAAAQESPADLMRRLFRPSVDAFASVFRPVTKPKPKPPAETDLLDVPMPRLRPGDDQPPPLLGYAPVTPPSAMTSPPPAPEFAALPADPLPPSPLTQSSAIAPPTPHPAPKVAALPADPLASPRQPATACRVALAQLGVGATALAPISENECGIATPVAVASLANGAIDFSTKAIIGCDLAETLATWFDGTVQAKARAILGGRVDGIRVAASYACRTRDSIPGAKMSEHAFGRAIDISAFRVDGRWIDVKSGWGNDDADGDFLAAVSSSACGPFKTVLGPGADEFHTDHFHLDLEPRRNGSTYCE